MSKLFAYMAGGKRGLGGGGLEVLKCQDFFLLLCVSVSGGHVSTSPSMEKISDPSSINK